MQTLLAARAEHYALNEFGEDGGASRTWDEAQFGPIPYAVPNTRARADALRVHDLHHVLTDYETDWRSASWICVVNEDRPSLASSRLARMRSMLAVFSGPSPCWLMASRTARSGRMMMALSGSSIRHGYRMHLRPCASHGWRRPPGLLRR